LGKELRAKMFWHSWKGKQCLNCTFQKKKGKTEHVKGKFDKFIIALEETLIEKCLVRYLRKVSIIVEEGIWKESR